MEREQRRERYNLRVSKREILYVDDEPEHSLTMVELVGEPIDYEPGIAGEFVSRRSITFQDLIRGSGTMQGYVMADFEHGSLYSRFEGRRDGTFKVSVGTWKTYRGTGKVAQDNRFHVELDQVLDYICEIIYEKKTKFEKCRQKCYSPPA